MSEQVIDRAKAIELCSRVCGGGFDALQITKAIAGHYLSAIDKIRRLTAIVESLSGPEEDNAFNAQDVADELSDAWPSLQGEHSKAPRGRGVPAENVIVLACALVALAVPEAKPEDIAEWRKILLSKVST